MRGQNDQFYWIYCIFLTFWPLAGRSNWSLLLDMLIFRLFDLLLGGQSDWFYWIFLIFFYFLTFRAVGEMVRGQNDRFYWIYWIFSPFDLLVGGQNNRFNWINWIFSTFRLFNLLVGVKMINFTEYNVFVDFPTFRPLDGRSRWSILLNILDFFDFSTSWWEVKMIKFTEYIGIFRLFDFSISCREVKMIDITEYIVFFQLFGLLLEGQLSDFTVGILSFSDFSTSRREVKMINFTEYIDFFEYPPFWPLGGRTEWLILLNIILNFSTFRLFDLVVGSQNDQYYGIYWFFDFSTFCWEVKLIDFIGYIGFFRLFDFSNSCW